MVSIEQQAYRTYITVFLWSRMVSSMRLSRDSNRATGKLVFEYAYWFGVRLLQKYWNKLFLVHFYGDKGFSTININGYSLLFIICTYILSIYL